MAGFTSLTELYSRLTPELPGVSIPELLQNIKDVVRDFSTQTECWQVTLSQTLTANTLAYTLAPTQTEANISRIVSVTIEDMAYPIDPMLWEFNGITTLTLDERVKPVSALADGLVTKVVLVPKPDSALWDAALLNRWADAIVLGVKARLMDNDKESWGNPRRAKDFKYDYGIQVALGKGETLRKFKTGSLTVTGRSWL